MLWTLLFILAAGVIINWAQTCFRGELDRHFKDREVRRALLVISHPDDESMFFSPTLEFLVGREIDVEVLCLSNGNAEGLGTTREGELYSALTSAYRIKPSAVTVLDSEAMQDGMTDEMQWDDMDVGNAIVSHVKARGEPIDLVVSFDEHGVSGHQNHISTHRGLERARSFWASARSSKKSDAGEDINAVTPSFYPREVWYLESVALWRKYCVLLDIIAVIHQRQSQRGGDSRVLTIPISNPAVVWLGMLHHRSQLVWYRYLFVAFSRYSYINTVKVAHV